MNLSPKHPALKERRTIHTKKIKDPPLNGNILKPGSKNAKLGFIITKGKWKGQPIFSLTLEERKTCPSYCVFWKNCYGNNLYLAHRWNHEDSKFLDKLESEVEELDSKYPNGFVVRLHVLGDFYSTDYVNWWGKMLNSYPKSLNIFGYSAYKHGPIYQRIKHYSQRYPDRFAIRISGTNWNFSTNRYSPELKGIICPEEQGKVKSCNECGICWNRNVKKPILFIEH